MDEELTLHELSRLDAQRKLGNLPKPIHETAWVRDAQIEAVIDAVLAVALGGDLVAYCRARHVGEWCARIASALPCGPEPAFARRVGVLSDVDPAALERIVELKHLSDFVREYQLYAIKGVKDARTTTLIVAVADEFDARLSCEDRGNSPSPSLVLRSISERADENSHSIVNALARAIHVDTKRVA